MLAVLGALGHAVQFQTMVDEFEAQFLRHATLELFDLFVAEFDHAAGLNINEMIVM